MIRKISYLAGLSFLFLFCTHRYYSTVKDKKIVAVSKDIKPDSATEAFVKPYREQLETKMNRVIGYSKTELNKSEGESPLGNFVADAILLSARRSSAKPVDMAAVNNGGLRAPLPKGPITVGNIFELMPFENELIIMELNGRQTRQFFDFQAIKKTHIANTNVKVANGTPVQIMIGGLPFDSTRSYTIALSDFMANNEPAFLKDLPKTNTGIKLRELLIERFEGLSAKNDSAFAKIEGRLIIDK